MNKVFTAIDEALADVRDGAAIMVGGFGGAGTPHNLVEGLARRGARNLTMICNSFNQLMSLPDAQQVSKLIASLPIR